MDPDAVKSTLSNLAFGNVIAAAARDYQKVTHPSSSPPMSQCRLVRPAMAPLWSLRYVSELAEEVSSGAGVLDLLVQVRADALVNGDPALVLDCKWKLTSVANRVGLFCDEGRGLRLCFRINL
jgi:hypothetical protein